MFLGFTNFNRRFIRNFNKITASLISILQTTDKSTSNKSHSTRTNNNKKDQDITSAVGRVGIGGIGKNIENLSSVIKSAKFMKPNLTKFNSFGTDFLIPGAKEAFIHL